MGKIIGTTVAGWALCCGALALAPQRAEGKPGEHELEGPGVLTLDVSMPLFHVSNRMRVGGVDVVLGPADIDAKNRFRTWVRIARDGRPEIVPVSGALRHTKKGYKVRIKGKSVRDGKTDAVISLSGLLDGRTLTGKGSLKIKSTGVVIKNDTLTGTLAGGHPSFRRMDLRLQGNLDEKGRFAPSPDLAQFVHFRGNFLRLDRWKGSSKAGKSGDDRVKILGKGPGGRVIIRGINTGTGFSGNVQVKWGKLRYDQDFDVASINPAPANPISVGSGRTDVTIPPSGILESDLVVTTDLGAKVTIPAGFALVNRLQQSITGGVRVTVDDSDVFVPRQGEPVLGAFAITCELLGATGAGKTSFSGINATSSPFAPTIEFDEFVDALLESSPVTSVVGPDSVSGVANIVTRNFVPPSEALSPTGASDWVFLESGIYTARPTGRSTSGTAGTEQTFVVPIDGDDAGEYPRVKRLTLRDRTTGAFLASGTVTANGGLTLGGSADCHDLDGVAQYSFEVGGSGGGRTLTIRSSHGNALHVTYTYCDPSGDEFTKVVRTDPGDVRSGSTRLGPAVLRVRGHRSFVQDPLLVLAADVNDAAGSGNDEWVARRGPISLDGGFRGGVTTAAGDFESDFLYDTVTGSPPDRQDVIGGVPPLIGGVLTETVSGADIGLNPVDPVVGAINVADSIGILTIPDLSSSQEVPVGRPGNMAIDPLGCRMYVVQDDERLCVVDAKTGEKLRELKIKCLNQAVAVSRDGARVFVATSKGEFLALDALTLEVLWRIGGLPNGAFLASLSLDREGRCAWMVAPDLNQLIGIDLLRRIVKPIVPVAVRPDFCDVSPGGDAIVVANRVGGMATVFDLSGVAPPMSFTLGPNLIQVKYGSGGTFYGTSQGLGAPNDGSVARVDGATDAITTSTFPFDSPTGLVVLPGGSGGGGGGDRLVVGDFGARRLHALSGDLTVTHSILLDGPPGQMASSED